MEKITEEEFVKHCKTATLMPISSMLLLCSGFRAVYQDDKDRFLLNLLCSDENFAYKDILKLTLESAEDACVIHELAHQELGSDFCGFFYKVKPLDFLAWLKSRDIALPMSNAKIKGSQTEKSLLQENKYWMNFQGKVEASIHAFSSWKKTQGTIQKTGNLQDWLVGEMRFDNREAEIVKKVLSEEFRELK